uniref:Uncharacterized protein n=1 Tax=Kalmanozyma brasiliensis (strain GHG001) TaxID=1365824 RepID=V5EW36_KALBG
MRRDTQGVTGTNFCLHGNVPVDVSNACKTHQKRVIPTGGQVDHGIDAGDNGHLAAVNAADGSCDGSPALRKRLVPSPDHIGEIVRNDINADQAVHSAQMGEGSGTTGDSDEGVNNEGAGLGSSITSLVAGLLSGQSSGFGAIEDVVNHGIGLGKQAGVAHANDHPPGATGLEALQDAGGPSLITQGGDANQGAPSVTTQDAASPPPAPARRNIDDPYTAYQILTLVTAAFRESDASIPPPPRIRIFPRTPLGPAMMMMGGGMGGMQILTQMMPVILAGIQAGAKIGVALLQYLEAREIEKAQTQAANRTAIAAEAATAKGSTDVEVATGGTQRTGSEDATGAASAKEEGLVELLEGWSRFGDASTTFTKTMAAHCTAKCVGFVQAARAREGFVDRANKCAGNPNLFGEQEVGSVPGRPVAAFVQRPYDGVHNVNAANSLAAAWIKSPDYSAGSVATKQRQGNGSSLSRRSVSTAQCHAGYQSLFTNVKRPVTAYEHKLFGSVVSDPSSFLHWGLVRSVSQCLTACDQTDGCVFVNIYQQTFSLDNPSIKLTTRSEEAPANEDAGEGEERKKQFAHQPERKKNSFVPGNLTCALYSRCFGECEARIASGGDSPVCFERSRGFCKSKGCAQG